MKRRKVVDVYMIRQGVQLIVGLWLFGVRIALMLRAGLGLDPWDVLHQGISVRNNVSIGVVVLVVSVLVTGSSPTRRESVCISAPLWVRVPAMD